MFVVHIPHGRCGSVQKAIRRCGGSVTVLVESQEVTECYFLLEKNLIQDLQNEFPQYEILPAETIDWNEQSAQHSPFYKNGRIELPLPNEKVLFLEPGPAFGDASHPTTRLTLELLLPEASGRSVLDVGCGNGVLTLAAYLSGASKVVGVDIDEEALEVARRNAQLNELDGKMAFITPLEFAEIDQPFDVFVANMTLGDLQNALPCYGKQIDQASTLVFSGILHSQEKSLRTLLPRNFKLVSRVLEGEWEAVQYSRIWP